MPQALSIRLNALGLVAISIVLLVAFLDQLIYHDLPCPLCLLQRAGIAAAGFGLALNIRFGPRASHYGLMILGALAGGSIAVRQILLHIVPGTGSYGDPFLGLHYYTWVLVVCWLIIAGTAAMLLFDRQFTDNDRPARFDGLGLAAFGFYAAMVIGNALSTLIECGGGLCPDNPTTYLLLP